MARRVFIVTGANKGIGFEVVKKLRQELKKEDAVIVMTSRCPDKGQVLKQTATIKSSAPEGP